MESALAAKIKAEATSNMLRERLKTAAEARASETRARSMSQSRENGAGEDKSDAGSDAGGPRSPRGSSMSKEELADKKRQIKEAIEAEKARKAKIKADAGA